MDRLQPTLLPMTPEAREALRDDEVVLDTFPFRVGRESRFQVVDGEVLSLERRGPATKPNNELYLVDHGELVNVSREHFQIEKTESGTYELADRGSRCGTVVDGQQVGGDDAGGRAPIRDGSLIVVGVPDSPFAFRFLLLPEA